MKYCKDTTCNHYISVHHANCIEPLREIILTEGANVNLFDSEHVALNLDKVEIAQKKAERNPTCDFMFGISSHITGRENRKIVFVECKFRVEGKNYNQNFKDNVVNKISYSQHLVGNSIPVFDCKYVLVNPNVLQQARRRFATLFPKNSGIIPSVPSEIHTLFFNQKAD